MQVRSVASGAQKQEAVVSWRAEYLTGSQWIDVFRYYLGVSWLEAKLMLGDLVKNKMLVARRNGDWGVKYKMRSEE